MALLALWPINTHLATPGFLHSLVVSLLVLCPFPFYWYLWTYPKKWMKMCEGVDPSHRMAQVSHILKSLQLLSLVSVATFSVPPLICVALFGCGQFLNYRYCYSLNAPYCDLSVVRCTFFLCFDWQFSLHYLKNCFQRYYTV